MQHISQILKILIQTRWTHFTYLGLLLAKENVKAELWSKQVGKMNDKIQNWGVMWLNLAGRMIMVKALLLALPIN